MADKTPDPPDSVDQRAHIPTLSKNQLAALVQFTEIGAANGCPFCQSRMVTEVSPGDRIILIKGPRLGCSATVSSQPGLDEGEFLVHIDDDPSTSLYRVSYSRTEFLMETALPAPEWMCELSMSDLEAVESAAIRSLMEAFRPGGRTIRVEAAEGLVALVWGRRLPVSGELLWPMLQKHGYDEGWRTEFQSLFDFGRSLLVTTAGRKAIKKKAVKRMSSYR